MELFLPKQYNIVRKLVDAASTRVGIVPRVGAEVESAITLKALVQAGLGATVLPASMAREVAGQNTGWCRRIVEPVIEAPLTLCQSDHLPLSESAEVVRTIVLNLVAELAANPSWLPDSGNRAAP